MRLRIAYRLLSIVLLAQVSTALPQKQPASVAAIGKKSWEALKHITRKRNYTAVLLDGSCIRGRITKVTDTDVTLKTAKDERSLGPQDLLRFSDVWGGPHDPVFSGRSSWTDVLEAKPVAKEYLLFVTTDGRKRKWKSPVFVDETVSYKGDAISRKDIRYVYYVRVKPITENEEDLQRESATFLAPRLWFGSTLLPTMEVLIYDSSVPENNQPLTCPR
jgi:hypothetical protein